MYTYVRVHESIRVTHMLTWHAYVCVTVPTWAGVGRGQG